MKNILKIFLEDFKSLRYNVIAMIIILGLAIVPSMYAWFNIAASWSPYENTGNLKVAIANSDRGYQGELLPIEINIGDKIVGTLQENDDLDWVFTTEKQAIEGTRSGDYYAALVVTEDFSKDMISVFSKNATNPVIKYYSNEKENAISPKVTDKASGALQQKIDEAFAATVSETMVKVFQSISSYMDEEQTQTFLGEMKQRLNTVGDNLTFAADTVDSYGTMADSLITLLNDTSALLAKTEKADKADRSKLKDSADKIRKIPDSLDGISELIDGALTDSAGIYSNLGTQIDSDFATLANDREAISGNLKGMADDVQTLIDRYTGWRNDLEDLAEKVMTTNPSKEIPRDVEISGENGSAQISSNTEITVELSTAEKEKIRKHILNAVTRLDRSINRQKSLRDKLSSADDLLTGLKGNISDYRDDLDKQIDACAKSITDLKNDVGTDLTNDLNELADLLTAAGDDALALRKTLGTTVKDSTKLLDETGGTLGDMRKLLKESGDDLRNASKRLDTWIDDVNQAIGDKSNNGLNQLLSRNTDLLTTLWASPVALETKSVYAVENYGSAMAPFYTVLSIWVGGIIMVAMMKTNVSDKRCEQLENNKNGKVRHTELYFGRSLFFILLGLIQSTIICLGNLLFLGIQCPHPFLFLLSGWVSSVIYVLLIYTMTISFGDVGKAIAVILLVIQVAGSGGTFPIETAPAVFKHIYPLLPFVHSMNAMRECIAGMYQNAYWMDLLKLLMYLVPILILGLLLRRPIIKLNRFFEEKLEEVKFM